VERSSGAAPPRRPGGDRQDRTGEGEPLTVQIERTQEGITIFGLGGELDLSTVPRLEGWLYDELRRGEMIVVDLSRLTFIDSSGIGLLIKAHRQTEDAGALHTVVAKGSQVERVFNLTGIGIALPLFVSRDDAIGALVERPG
jgi:anti-anti-sigma factor